jgi:2-isopropylmalate synthase
MRTNGLVELFDTTLRDGTQSASISVSIQDKLLITQKLDEFGIEYIEGGWPGSNPRDEEYFNEVKKIRVNYSKICAFGSTARSPKTVESDVNLQKLLKAETPAISIFGKSWRLHSNKSLGLSDEENEDLIFKSVKFLRKSGREVIFDAEHFFDGFKDDQDFAIKMLKAAEAAGANVIVLCDTNGGTLPNEVAEIFEAVKKSVKSPLGIHAHNDGDVAVANSIQAVISGAVHVQGTINGFGERCGNANLCSVIPNLNIKLGIKTNQLKNLQKLTSLSHYVDELMNQVPNNRAAFVGKYAFTHKGGIHVSSILKDSKMYEHIDPSNIGNRQHVIISDLSGGSNIRYKAQEFGIDLPQEKEFSKKFVGQIKSLEYEGFQFDGAEASFELLLRTELNEFEPFFEVIYTKINVLFSPEGHKYAEAVLKVKVEDEVEHTAADGNGPVNALDKALRKALIRFYPEIKDTHLIDYKVRVLNERNGTAAKVRVLVESGDGEKMWSTVGVSHDIIEASLQALNDSLNFKILKMHEPEMQTG